MLGLHWQTIFEGIAIIAGGAFVLWLARVAGRVSKAARRTLRLLERLAPDGKPCVTDRLADVESALTTGNAKFDDMHRQIVDVNRKADSAATAATGLQGRFEDYVVHESDRSNQTNGLLLAIQVQLKEALMAQAKQG